MTKNFQLSTYICVDVIPILLKNAALTTTLYYQTDWNMINFKQGNQNTPRKLLPFGI
jgi:hypothetical protein